MKLYYCWINGGKGKYKGLQDFKKTDILLMSSGEQNDTLTKPDLLIIGSRTHRINLFVNTNKNFANNYTNTKRTKVYKKQIQRNEALYFLSENQREDIVTHSTIQHSEIAGK